ncbi:TIGR03767 family metallophosphoesterase [Arthrobacter sp. ok362]|uniref:TIGR03767 family metallophosphoesterase n=1 Tax=Arthrobacter sp. ok362 TaxID=1761745 RepID=UPI000884051C|nr:TIGR03767 family metallophosphoesterase [Arthrobacter sp. ok362]SDL11527.1 metallophosphoesterase, PPA1498 family [Arthrobacter sp. ok362]
MPEPSAPLSTLEATVILGSRAAPRLPYQRLARGPALETLVREDLCTRSRAVSGRRIGLATFGHLTDAHVLDAANPGRLSFLWQYFDFSDGYPSSGKFRPQDLLTVHVLDATVRKLNAVRFGPLSERPLDCLVTTGDVTNTFAVGELSAAVGVFKGGSVTSHPTAAYDGVQDHGPAPRELSKSIWHPEPENTLISPDDWKALHGYPTVPGFLTAAIKPVRAQGSDFPWYIGVGNHDEAGRSPSGTISAKAEFVDALRTGDRLPIQLPQGMNATDFWNDVRRSNGSERRRLITSLPSRTVRASKLRRPFTKAEFMDALPDGEAKVQFGSGPDAEAKPYYTFDIAPEVIGIMLNTASPDGSIKAVLDAGQADWLEEQLRGASANYYDSKGKLTASSGQGRLVVLFSHHPLSTFDEEEQSSDGGRPPLNRSAVLGLLSRYPNVVAWMNGHRHKHRVTPHKGKHGSGGFWEITTASLIDYPQQSRVVELMDNGDGTLSIAATLVDHSTPEGVLYEGEHTAASLAALSLELALNRPGLDRAEISGGIEDQNVDLILNKPF